MQRGVRKQFGRSSLPSRRVSTNRQVQERGFMFSIKFRQIRAQLVGSTGILALTAGAALAQTATFSLPSEPLSDSLKAVARQTGQNILFTPQSIAGVTAPALRGE